jgi:hypothetical protein
LTIFTLCRYRQIPAHKSCEYTQIASIAIYIHDKSNNFIHLQPYIDHGDWLSGSE